MSISAHLLKILKPVIGPPTSTGAAGKFHMIHAGNTVPWLTSFCLHASMHLEVEFEDGCSFRLSAEFLRVNSPAVDVDLLEASCGNHESRTNRKLRCEDNVRRLEQNRDLHMDLHRLEIDKFSLMRSYIRTLKKHGPSRDPIKRK